MSKPKEVARRALFRAALAGALASRTGGPATAQQQKLSKQDALYQDAPKDDHACGTCTLFQPPRSCKVVAGDISDHGWCTLFEESPE